MDLWEPDDLETSQERDEILREHMRVSLQVFNNSRFLIKFKEQLEQVIRSVLPLGTHKLIMYGIGNFEQKSSPRLQLSLAIWMKKNLNWIGECEFFDPALTQTEVNYLVDLGFSCIKRDEWGKRQVGNEPILFYMPHCPRFLYNNLLGANRTWESIENIVLIGNDLKMYLKEQEKEEVKEEQGQDELVKEEGKVTEVEEIEEEEEEEVDETIRYIHMLRRNIQRFEIDTFPEDDTAFSYTAWQIFKQL